MSLVADNTGISLEDQVDVTLFTSVDAIVEFLSLPKQKKFAKYPPSLFRIVTNRRLFVKPDGLCARISSNDTWRSVFPAIMVVCGSCNDGLDALQGRPNLKITQNLKDCELFVSFETAGVAALKATEALSHSQVIRTAKKQNAKECKLFVSFQMAEIACMQAVDGTSAAPSQVLRTANNPHALCKLSPPVNMRGSSF